jgi:hypothetical protein
MSDPSVSNAIDEFAFTFEPIEPNLSGSAFSWSFKALTWGMCLALLVWMIKLQLPMGNSSSTWAWTAWVMLTYTAWVIHQSRLHLDKDLIRQDWIWTKQLKVSDLVFIQVIRIPFLEWLLAPRIYARTFQGKSVFFYCSDRKVLSEMSRMTEAHKEWFEKRLSTPSSPA